MVRKQKAAGVLAGFMLMALLALPVQAATTVTYWVWGWAPEMQVGIDKAIAQFEEMHPDIKVDKQVGVELDQLLATIAGGAPPDLVLGTTTIYEALLALEAIKPLNERYAATTLWQEQLLPGLDSAILYKGVEYAVPGGAVYPTDGLVWNKTMFAEAGLAPLSSDEAMTWAQLAELAGKLVRRSAEGDLTRIGYHPKEGRNSNPDVLEAYFDLNLYKNGTPSLNDPDVVTALDFLNDAFMLRQARGHDEILEFADGGWYLIGQRMTAMANLGAYAHAELSARVPEDEFGVTWHPTWNGEKKQQIVTFRHFIPVGARHTDAAWKLAAFLASSVDAQQFVYDTTGFFGPSLEFISEFRADDPMTQWYIASMSEAQSLRFEVPFRFGEGIPSPDDHLNTAKFAVFEQEPAPSVLEQANVAWQADIKRQTEQR